MRGLSSNLNPSSAWVERYDYDNGEGSFELGLVGHIDLVTCDFLVTGNVFDNDFIYLAITSKIFLTFQHLNRVKGTYALLRWRGSPLTKTKFFWKTLTF